MPLRYRTRVPQRAAGQIARAAWAMAQTRVAKREQGYRLSSSGVTNK